MFLFSALLLAPSLVSAAAIQQRGWLQDISSAVAFQESTPLSPSSNTLALRKQKSTKGYNAKSAHYLLHKQPSKDVAASTDSTQITSLAEGQEFAASIMIGGQTFEAIIDTGSSDTWVVEAGFKCVSPTNGASESESTCDFGPTFAVDKGFSQISDENFNITYADGEYLTGIVGTDTVSLAGLSVKQEIGLVNYAAWAGDGKTSGLIGLAYPTLTSAYSGINPHDDSTPDNYSPLFKTLYTQNLVSPLFSLAIERDISGPSGYLSLGGTPPVSFTDDFTSTPILTTSLSDGQSTYAFYTITVGDIELDSFGLGGDTYIVDSGTTLLYAPSFTADIINELFSPAATYSQSAGAYIVDCNATPPSLGVKIGGTTFNINALDLVLLAGTDTSGADVCISGINDGGLEGPYILGDVFLKNVVAVFDVGASEMKFAAREDYTSNDPY